MNHLDLFSGIGGFSLAASWVWGKEHNIVSFVEIDNFCQKVLKKHWPDVPIHDDIRTYKHDGTTINLLTGGFPCQPFSCAGKQGGEKDDRYLWPEMLRVIQEFRPTWIIGENVAGIINMALDQVLSDLENEGYTCQPFIIPACGKDAPHRRDRVWIVGNNDGGRCLEKQKVNESGCQKISLKCTSQDVAYTTGSNKGKRVTGRTSGVSGGKPFETETKRHGGSGNRQRDGLWLPEPNVGRVAHGVSNRVDRLKSLGNAIVPQVVVPIMQAIKDIDENKTM